MKFRNLLPLMRGVAYALPALILLAGCGPAVYYVRPADWQDTFKRDSVLAFFAPSLKDVTVFLDPGHGGSDRASVGPAGDVVEADANLRVALRLREYLKKAGANVLVSRETDKTVPLEARAEQANVNKADIFVSIHHNAAPDPFTNYTACYYHAREGELGWKPSSRDLARYIQRDLSYVMGNPGPLASFDGTLSDYTSYPGQGFAVLRNTSMTAVLVECGFFTSAYEEKRLRIEEFNDIQAWGIFRGIARYLHAGIPTLQYVSERVFHEATPRIELQVHDRGSEVLDESIRVDIDGEEAGYTYNRKSARISVRPTGELAQGYHLLRAQVRNTGGNASAPFEVHFAVGHAPAALRSAADPAIVSRDSAAFSIITISAVDSAGRAVPDGLRIRFSASTGLDTMLALRGGSARVYVYPRGRERVTFTASNGPVRTEGIVTSTADAHYTRGIILGTDGKPVRDAQITLPGGRSSRTNDVGEYIFTGTTLEGIEGVITAPGYFAERIALNGLPVQDPAVLRPIAQRTLAGRSYLLETMAPSADGKPRVDVLAAEQLASLLRASGAQVAFTTSSNDSTRRTATSVKGVTVLQFEEEKRIPALTVRCGRSQTARNLAARVQKVLPLYSSVPFGKVVQSIAPQRELKVAAQVQCALPAASTKVYDEALTTRYAWNVAWACYTALLLESGYGTAGTNTVSATVLHKATQKPAASVAVLLGGSLRAMTDANGVARYLYVSGGEDRVEAVDPAAYVVKSVSTDLTK